MKKNKREEEYTAYSCSVVIKKNVRIGAISFGKVTQLKLQHQKISTKETRNYTRWTKHDIPKTFRVMTRWTCSRKQWRHFFINKWATLRRTGTETSALKQNFRKKRPCRSKCIFAVITRN